jgi:hypothetical protein
MNRLNYKMLSTLSVLFQSRKAGALGDLPIALYPVSILDPILLPVEVPRLENPSVSPEC